MVTDSWEAVKGRFAVVARRDRQLDATHRELAARSGLALEQAKSAQTQAWADILQDILDDDPGKAQALHDFLGYLRVSPQAVPRSQSQRASHGGVSIGGNNTGDIATDGSRIDKRRYRFFLPPVLFGHAVKAVTTHWVVSTVTVVVVVGGVTTGVALTHKGANTPAASPTVSASTPIVSPPAPSSVNWGALQGGPARTGAQADETRLGTGNVGKLALVRTYKTNGQPTAPLIVNGVLYVATNQLYAFDATGATNCSAAPTTCTPLWTAPTAYIDGMAIGGGKVFVTDAEGVQAYDAAGSENCSGTPKVCAPLWATSTNVSTGPGFTPGHGSPVVANGVLYVPGGGGATPSAGGAAVAAFAVAGKTGCSGTPTICVPMWTTAGLPVGISNEGSPAIANGVIYIANGTLLDAFDAAGSTGCSGTPKVCAPLWTAAITGGEFNSAPPAVSNGIVYVSNSLTGLYAFDATGTTNCSTNSTGKTCAPLWNAPSATYGGSLAVANGVVYEITGGGKLAAFDAAAATNCPGTSTVKTCTRAPRWTSASLASGPLTASPTVANGVVYASSSNGGIYAYDAAGSQDCAVPDTASSGTLTTVKACSPLWSGPAAGFTGGGVPAIVNGVLYVNVPGAASVYAYSL